MQTSLLLLIVRSSIINPVINFSTHLWPVKWNALGYTFALRIPSIFSNVDATHAPTRSTMIWSTSYHHMTVLVHRSWLHLLFTVALVYRRQVITQLALHTCKWSVEPSHVFDLLHLDHMTQCHVSYAMSSFITCVSLATYPSHLTSMACIAHTQVPVD